MTLELKFDFLNTVDQKRTLKHSLQTFIPFEFDLCKSHLNLKTVWSNEGTWLCWFQFFVGFFPVNMPKFFFVIRNIGLTKFSFFCVHPDCSRLSTFPECFAGEQCGFNEQCHHGGCFVFSSK